MVASQISVLGDGSGISLPATIVTSMAATRQMREFEMYWLALALVVIVLGAIVLLLRSRYGLALTAIRDNELAARSTGVDVWRIKLAIYIAVAFGTAMIGALIFLQRLRISPETAFSVNDWTAYVIFITVIGGIGRIEGPIIGTLVFFLLRRTLADLGSLYLLMLGAVAIAVMLLAPKGIWGFLAGRSVGSSCRWSGACALPRMPTKIKPCNKTERAHGRKQWLGSRQGRHHLRHHRLDPHADHVGCAAGHSRPDRPPGDRGGGSRRAVLHLRAQSAGRTTDRRPRRVPPVPARIKQATDAVVNITTGGSVIMTVEERSRRGRILS